MKRTILLIAIALTGSCKQEPENVQRMEELLHGDWYGVEVTNHLIAQGLWDTLHPHSITDLIGTFDTLIGTFVVDSLGETLDSADLVIDSDSVITVNGAVNAIDWSFDRQLINRLEDGDGAVWHSCGSIIIWNFFLNERTCFAQS